MSANINKSFIFKSKIRALKASSFNNNNNFLNYLHGNIGNLNESRKILQ